MLFRSAHTFDTEAEVDLVKKKCQELGVNVAVSKVWANGGEGGIELAEEVLRLIDEEDRCKVPVIADEQGILSVGKFRNSENYKVDAETKEVLKVSFKKL